MHEGAPGWARESRAALFLAAVLAMAGEGTFYEAATERDARFVELVHKVAVADWPWLARFLPLAAD